MTMERILPKKRTIWLRHPSPNSVILGGYILNMENHPSERIDDGREPAHLDDLVLWNSHCKMISPVPDEFADR